VSEWNSNPVVLTVAITGADVFRENNPNIPYTTEEIAESSIEASAAGATVVHLHVREDDGTPSGRPELFVDVIDRIRAGCDVLTMVSTGGANGDNRGFNEANHDGVVDDDVYFAHFDGMTFKPVKDDPLSATLPAIQQTR